VSGTKVLKASLLTLFIIKSGLFLFLVLFLPDLLMQGFDMFITFLNYQPFGDHGVYDMLSFRVIHVLSLCVIIYLWVLAYQDVKSGRY